MADDSPYAAPTTLAPDPASAPPGTRPTGVTVIAIMCLVFAGMSVFGTLGTAALFFFDFEVAGPNPTADLLESNEFFRTFTIVSLGLSVVATAVLAFAGIKLLGMRDVGRKAANAYAIYTILMSIVGVVINVMFVFPALIDATDGDETAQQAAMIGGIIGGVIGAVLTIGFAGAILFVLNRSSIRHLYR